MLRCRTCCGPTAGVGVFGYEIHLSLRPNPPIDHFEHSTEMRRLTSLPEKFTNYPLVGLAGTGNDGHR